MNNTLQQILIEPLPLPSQVGDAAIAVGAITLLRQAFPEAKITGVAERLVPSDQVQIAGFLHTYDVDEVIRAPLSLDGPADGVSRLRRACNEFILGGGKYAAPAMTRLLGEKSSRLLPEHLRKLVEKVATSDLVIMRGGGYLSSPHLWCDLLGLRLNAINTITVARALKVPYAIWGHSLWELNGPLSKRLLWPLIRESALTACREEISYRYLVDAGAPADRLRLLPDTALALEPISVAEANKIRAYENLDDPTMLLLGINVRPPWDVNLDYNELSERYLDATAELIRHMHDRYGTKAVLISHCHSTPLFHVPNFQDERELQQRLLDRISGSATPKLLKGDYTPQELAGLYRTLEMMVTTRLHAGILASLSATPTAYVAYEKNKTCGIARMLGLSDFVIDIETIDAVSLVANAEKLWHRRQEIRAHLQAVLPQIRAQLGEYSRLTMQGMAK